MLNKIAYFFIGATSGAVLTYIFIKSKYEKLAQEEIDEMKEYYKKQDHPEDKIVLDEAVSKKIFKTREKDPLSETAKQYDSLRNEYSAPENKVNYQRYSSEDKEAEAEQEGIEYDADLDYDVPDYPREEPSENPYSIDATAFANEFRFYDKISYIYYQGNKVLATEDDEIIDDISGTVGEGFASHIGEFEEGVAYIRNEKRGCDYEVILNEGDFYEG